MKRSMLALAAASAFALFAQADSLEQAWFDTEIPGYTSWPTNNAVQFKGSWSFTADTVELDTSVQDAAKLILDTDADAPLTFTTNENADEKDLANQAKSVTINSEVEFNPFDSEKMPAVPEGAKAGIIVVTNTSENTLQYYVLAKDGETNAWTAAEGAVASLEAAVSIAITNELADAGNNLKAMYKVDETVLTVGGSEFVEVAFGDNTKVSAVSYSGSGIVKNLTATYRGTDVNITIPEVINATVAVTNRGEEVATAPGDITVPMGTSLSVVYACAAGYVFADGVTTKSFEFASVSDSTEIDVKDVTAKLAEAQVNGVYYTTLANAIAASEEGEVVEVLRALALTAPVAITKAAAVDLKTFTVANASGAAFAIDAGADNTVTIKNGVVKGTTGITVASGTLVIDGTEATSVEGTDGPALAFTGAADSADLDYIGIPTFKSSNGAAVTSINVKGILDLNANEDSALFAQTADMAADLLAADREFGKSDVYTIIVKAAAKIAVWFFDDDSYAVETNVVAGSKILPPDPAPEKSGSKLVGWTTDLSAEPVILWNFNTDVVNEETYLFAVWEAEGPTTHKLDLTLNENVTKVTYQVGTEAPASVVATTLGIEVADGETVTIVEVCYALGYTRPDSGDKKDSEKVAEDDIAFEFSAKELGSGDLPQDVTPSEVGITSGAFADAQPAEVNKVVKWAVARGISLPQINAMNFAEPTPVEEAYLLGTAVNDAAIKAAKDNFKFSAITPGVVPEVGGTANFNGTVTIQGSDDLKNWSAPADAAKKFFRATLTR